jgi:hypothetical protein
MSPASICAAFQRRDDVFLGVARRREEHRHRFGDIRAQPPQHFDARHVGQLPVEHVQVEAFAREGAQEVAGARVHMRCVARPGEPDPHEVRLGGIVFEQCDAHGYT